MADARRPEKLDLRQIIGANLRAAQAEKGLKDRELAAAGGVDLRSYARHKAGTAMPGPDAVVKYAAALDVSPGWLFEDHRDRKAAA